MRLGLSRRGFNKKLPPLRLDGTSWNGQLVALAKNVDSPRPELARAKANVAKR
jgi:hypothetical protein